MKSCFKSRNPLVHAVALFPALRLTPFFLLVACGQQNFELESWSSKVDLNSSFSKRADYLPEIPTGIQNNLTWASKAEIDEMFSGEQMGQLGVNWYREVLQDSAHSENFAHVVKVAHSKGMKVSAVIMSMDEDYDNLEDAREYRGSEWKKACGWDGHVGRISRVNLERLKSRLDHQFSVIANNGESLDVVEVGNELDQICFNADVPWGRTATANEVKLAQKAYAKFLEASVLKIRQYFPNAVILPFAPAHFYPDLQGFHFVDDFGFIAGLKNIDGVNYLALTNGIALHAYPKNKNLGGTYEATSATDLSIIKHAASVFGKSTPIYITEWGFDQGNSQTRHRQMTQFLQTVDSFKGKANIQATMYFAYKWGVPTDLIDTKTGKLTPEAFTLNRKMPVTEEPKPAPTSPTLSPVNPLPPAPQTGFPDLVVSEIIFNPAVPMEGEPFSVGLRIKNVGFAPVGGSGIWIGATLAVNGFLKSWAGSLMSAPLLPGGELFIYTPAQQVMNLSTGSYQIQAHIDDQHVLAEGNENNNIVSVQLVVSPRSLAPAPAPAPPSTSAPGPVVATITKIDLQVFRKSKTSYSLDLILRDGRWIQACWHDWKFPKSNLIVSFNGICDSGARFKLNDIVGFKMYTSIDGWKSATFTQQAVRSQKTLYTF
ncbi:MAG: hypothetical protein RJB66_2577 [Pseudomonadota bacterium]